VECPIETTIPYKKTLQSDALLLLAAFFWGTTFVAQRCGMDHIGPMTYNGVRFALGALTVLPFAIRTRHRPSGHSGDPPMRKAFLGCCLAGVFLFAGASFQQFGLLHTTVAKAGFITSLYVVLVPVFGLLLGHRCGIPIWAGVGLSVIGLYLMTITESLTIGRGDLLELIGAAFWALHVLQVGHLARRIDPFRIALVQFTACSLLCLLSAAGTETMTLATVKRALIPLLYGGVLSAGIAFTLQIVSQQRCPPAHAAVIMSLETVFAVLAGWIVLGEMLTPREIVGALLILGAVFLVQLPPDFLGWGGGKTRS
jgi:drug/metabolite transporter (DMT)-like permease